MHAFADISLVFLTSQTRRSESLKAGEEACVLDRLSPASSKMSHYTSHLIRTVARHVGMPYPAMDRQHRSGCPQPQDFLEHRGAKLELRQLLLGGHHPVASHRKNKNAFATCVWQRERRLVLQRVEQTTKPLDLYERKLSVGGDTAPERLNNTSPRRSSTHTMLSLGTMIPQ